LEENGAVLPRLTEGENNNKNNDRGLDMQGQIFYIYGHKTMLGHLRQNFSSYRGKVSCGISSHLVYPGIHIYPYKRSSL
jgi:hypothetical protein